MKLLIITQKIDKNDDVLGFMHGWIAAFAKECDEVIAVGLFVGAHELPSNVRVYSLGKDKGLSRLDYIKNFYKIIWGERKNYDAVFVHMNEVYINLGALIWKSLGKKFGLWYAHGHVPWTLRLATFFSEIIFTSTKSGFRLPTEKLRIMGQGIDTDRFSYSPRYWKEGESFRIIVVGRISPVKDYETLLLAAKLLHERGANIHVDIVGGVGLSEQEVYFTKLQRLTKEYHLHDVVTFHGGVQNDRIMGLLFKAHCFVNTSLTGSFDKAVGEGMATGLPIFTCNEAFKDVLGDFAGRLMFAPHDDQRLATLLMGMLAMENEERNTIGRSLSELIAEKHSLKKFVVKIIGAY